MWNRVDRKKVQEVRVKLKEKYQREFDVEAVGKGFGTLTNHTQTLICFPKDNQEMKFKVEIDLDNTYMLDEYISTRISHEIEKKIRSSLREAGMNHWATVRTGSRCMIGCDKIDSVEAFLSMQQNAKFMIYIAVDEAWLKSSTGDAIFKELHNIFLDLPALDGAMEVYFIKEERLTKIDSYGDIGYQLEKGLKARKKLYILFENSVLAIKKDEFINLLKQ